MEIKSEKVESHNADHHRYSRAPAERPASGIRLGLKDHLLIQLSRLKLSI